MTSDRYDVVVVGGGPGGYAAALYGASAGLKIALVERDKVGGTCLQRGCVPAKELLETASVFRAVNNSATFGITHGEPTVDWSVTVGRKQQVVDTLTKGLSGLIKSRKIDTFAGTGRVDGPGRVVVSGADGETALLGDALILATGSAPRNIPGFDPEVPTPGGPMPIVVNSDGFLDLPDLPQRAAVIGGGAIGCEFASTLADMGSAVTIIEAMPKILPGCDEDITKVVLRTFKKRKIEVRTGSGVTGHERQADGSTRISLADGSTLDVDLIVVSVGRVPYTTGLGLETIGLAPTERGHIPVDENCKTPVDGVWSVGDCINTPQLAHVGFAEGMVAIRDILGENPVPIDYSKVPWAIYCHPEVAFAGHSEQSAVAAGLDVVTSMHQYRGNSRALILGEPDGVVKVIAERKPDGTGGKILGVHMVGPWVTEQLGQGYLAVNWEATVDEVAAFIQPHPTLSELFGETMMALTGRSLHG